MTASADLKKQLIIKAMSPPIILSFYFLFSTEFFILYSKSKLLNRAQQ